MPLGALAVTPVTGTHAATQQAPTATSSLTVTQPYSHSHSARQTLLYLRAGGRWTLSLRSAPGDQVRLLRHDTGLAGQAPLRL